MTLDDLANRFDDLVAALELIASELVRIRLLLEAETGGAHEMSKASRVKGLKGEREVRALWEAHGFTVRGLEGEGDHVILPVIRGLAERPPRRFTLHSEVKRTEIARPWAWMEQAEAEAPDGSVPVVSFRRNKSDWYALLRLDDLARLLA